MRKSFCGRFVIVASILMMFVSHGLAQSNLVYYNADDRINAPNFNPAFIPDKHKFTFTIFPFSGLSVGYNNQKVSNEMIRNFMAGGDDNERFREIFRSMLKSDIYFQRLEVPVLGFSYNTEKGSIAFRIKDNMRLLADLKGEMSGFLSDPAVTNIPMNQVQEFPIHAMYYREYSVGLAKEVIKKKLTVGIWAKAYFGRFSMISDVTGKASFEDGDYYFRTSKQTKLSFPINIELDEESNLAYANTIDGYIGENFILNSDNKGFGFDLGFDYRVSDDLSISASVTDLGQINWKSNLNSLDYIGEYKFDPDYIDQEGSDEYKLVRTPDFDVNKIQLPSLFKVNINPEPFQTALPITIYGGAKYQAGDKIVLGIANRYVHSAKLSYNSLMVSSDFDLKNGLRVLTGYGMIGPSYLNIPLAFVKNWSFGQFFIGTDNILALFSQKSDYTGVTFGATIFPFQPKGVKKQVIDYLPFFEPRK